MQEKKKNNFNAKMQFCTSASSGEPKEKAGVNARQDDIMKEGNYPWNQESARQMQQDVCT